MVGLWVISYVLDRPFKYQTSAKENKVASICQDRVPNQLLLFSPTGQLNHIYLSPH